MSKWNGKYILFFGALLGLLRIVFYFIVLKFKFDPGYTIDIIFVIYLTLWPLLLKPRKVYSVIYILFANLLIVAVSILVNDFFKIFYSHPKLNPDFFSVRGLVALSIFNLILISSACYFTIQSFFKSKWKHSSTSDFESIGQ
jgi:hypothetical protein